MIVNKGMDWLFDILMSTAGGSPLTYIAVGDSPNLVTADDTQLTNERFRSVITNIYRDTGTLVCETYYERDEANFSWAEAGLFAGGDGSPNTGILVARSLVAEDKDENKTATMVFEISITEA